jgi:hypothetical protein
MKNEKRKIEEDYPNQRTTTYSRRAKKTKMMQVHIQMSNAET